MSTTQLQRHVLMVVWCGLLWIIWFGWWINGRMDGWTGWLIRIDELFDQIIDWLHPQSVLIVLSYLDPYVCLVGSFSQHYLMGCFAQRLPQGEPREIGDMGVVRKHIYLSGCFHKDTTNDAESVSPCSTSGNLSHRFGLILGDDHLITFQCVCVFSSAGTVQ